MSKNNPSLKIKLAKINVPSRFLVFCFSNLGQSDIQIEVHMLIVFSLINSGSNREKFPKKYFLVISATKL